MTPEAWQKVKAVFDAAVRLPPDERPRYLDGACVDPALRTEVESLLSAASGTASFFDHPAPMSPSRTCSACGKPVPLRAGFCPSCGAATPTEVIDGSAKASSPQWGETQEEEQRQSLQAAVGTDYEILDQIGRGGFGVVFRANDHTLKRQVAIKVLRGELFEARTARSRFRQEAQAAARLRHPNIIPIFAVGDDASVSYIVMPLIKGESLAAVLAREGRVSPEEARRILIEAADALHCAHEAGIVHRDMKPENIMLEGPERRVLIMDFGIARLASTDFGTLTGAGMVIGTPWYMSPEQAIGSAQVDARSDIYSLGVVGYQLVTGKLPFQGATPQEVIAQHLIEAPQDPTVRHPEVPANFAAVVMRCLSKKPEERWTTAHDLSLVLSKEAATPPLQMRVFRKSVQGRWWLVGTVGVVAIAALASLVFPGGRTYDLYLRVQGSAEGLNTETKVVLQGLEVGRVVSVYPRVDSASRTIVFLAKLSMVERLMNGVDIRFPTGTRGRLEQPSQTSPTVVIRLVLPDTSARVGTLLEAGDTIDSYRGPPTWVDSSQREPQDLHDELSPAQRTAPSWGTIDSIRRQLAELVGQLSQAQRGAASSATIDSLRRELAATGAQAAALEPRMRAILGTDFTNIAQHNQGAVGLITVNFGRNSYNGTGFVISNDGYMLTNWHVVTDSGFPKPDSIWVTMADQSTAAIAELVASSQDRDIALIKIRDYHGPYLSAIDWGGTKSRLGKPAALIGYAPGAVFARLRSSVVRTTMTAGIISRVTDDVIQFDGMTTGGSSGSPIFNADGEVISMHRAIFPEAPSFALSVPIRYAVALLPSALKQRLGIP